MKKLLFIFSFLTLYFVSGQVTIYEEGFNDGVQPSDWTAEVTGPGAWIFTSDLTPGGVVESNYVSPFDSLAAIFDDDENGWSSGASIATLISPVFADEGQWDGTAQVEFEYACNFYPSNNGGRFYVEVFDGENWVEILSATSIVQPTVFSLPISDYTTDNQDFQVRFVFDDEGNWSWGAGVNYFKIVQEELSVSNISKNSFSVYPNPVKDIVNVNSSKNIKQIALFDLTGKQIVTRNNVSELNMSHLKAGIYVMKVALADGEVITQQLIKK